MSEITRLSVLINAETLDALKEISGKRHTSITEVVRHAVAVLKALEDADARGDEIQFEDRDGRVTVIELLWSE